VPALRRQIMPVGTYIAATAPLGAERARSLIRRNLAVADCNFVISYFRLSADHRLLFGGRVSYTTLMPPNLPGAMRRSMLGVFPQLDDVRFDYVWGGNVAITVERTPHLGRLAGDIYFAHGYSGLGVALTGGNSDTTSINFSFNAVYDPKTRNVLKIDALYLRTTSAGVATSDRISDGIRDEYGLTELVFAFAEFRYLRDRSKSIEYLFAPLVGAGYHVLKTKEMGFDADAAVGAVIEKDYPIPSSSSGAFHIGETFFWQITPTAKLTEAASGLWKTSNTKDALYHFEVALVTSISASFQLKAAFYDDYKNLPPDPKIKKNDTTFLAAVLYKF